MEGLAFSYQTWFTSPFPARRILAMFVRFQGPKLLKKDISHWRKGPTKILMYSLESLLQKRKHGKVCKGLLTSKHPEISSSKKNFTAGHWTPSWYMKRNESENFYALNILFCSLVCYLIWPGALSPCSSPRVSRSPCRPASLRPRRWRVKVLAFTSSQARLAFPPLDASNSGDFRQV